MEKKKEKVAYKKREYTYFEIKESKDEMWFPRAIQNCLVDEKKEQWMDNQTAFKEITKKEYEAYYRKMNK